MTKYITLTGKGQLTVPMTVRRAMGLDKEGATARLDYDPVTNRVYIEKVADIEALHAANKEVLQRQEQRTGGYHSGDGFRAHVRKKYGA